MKKKGQQPASWLEAGGRLTMKKKGQQPASWLEAGGRPVGSLVPRLEQCASRVPRPSARVVGGYAAQLPSSGVKFGRGMLSEKDFRAQEIRKAKVSG